MDYSQLQDFFMVLMAIFGCIVAGGGAVAVVVRFWKWAHKQSDDNAQSLDDVMEWLDSDKRRIETLEANQEEADRQNKMLLKAVWSLMSHALDGNHTPQLTSSRDEIQEYLFE